jgi:oligoribonuclease NrnB/cAMP/cGMP phosphodiesterase (DHH superfamily)
MCPIDYGDPFDYTFESSDTVYMLDWTLQPVERSLELAKTCHLIVLDHHKTSAELVGKVGGIVKPDNSEAGCQLTARFFFPIRNFLWVDLLGTYDIWKQGADWETEILPFQFGMRAEETDPTTDLGMKIWRDFFETNQQMVAELIYLIQNNGRLLLNFERKQNVANMQNAFEFTFEGLRALALIGSGVGSGQFDSRFDPAEHDFMMSINNVRNEHWRVSMYTTKLELDLSVLAKKWGGGGHARACGFQVDDINKVLKIGDNKPK